MNEIINGVTYKEYLLTLIRIVAFLDYLGENHKKNTSQERLVMYDFFLKYPELLSITDSIDFDTKYSYFHWKPNHKLYDAVLADAQARVFIKYDSETQRYVSTSTGMEFINNMSNTYIKNLVRTSEYVSRNICKLSSKAINEKINHILISCRGL